MFSFFLLFVSYLVSGFFGRLHQAVHRNCPTDQKLLSRILMIDMNYRRDFAECQMAPEIVGRMFFDNGLVMSGIVA
jgi:hypothetical protein